MLISILAVLGTFGLVIFLHEGGHFLLCKGLRVRVERFAFGFGPELIGFQYGETRYSLCAFPLGGFVKPAGESLEESRGDPHEYLSKSWTARLAIVLAGPAMNYLLAILLFTGVIYFWGLSQPSSQPVIGELVAGYPAAQAGLQAGDRILAVEQTAIASWQELAQLIHRRPGRKTSLSYERAGKKFRTLLVPRRDANQNVGLIGILPRTEHISQSLWSSLRTGCSQSYFWSAYTLKVLASHVIQWEKPDLAGPVGIVQMVSRAAHTGIPDFLSLVGLISLAIGLFNLFPIPMLDGGHAAFCLWEGLTRKRVTEKTMQVANLVGISVLIAILIFATHNDILRLRGGSWQTPEAQTPTPKP
ncbi:MAG: RIP metalloprotease RseP [Elusimicrobia bacterium]|nr:RIP metalloprotease RseP [Elusimicrobiota bacterium]